LAILKPNLNPVRMLWGVREQIFHDASGKLACALILLQYDIDFKTRLDVAANSTITCHSTFNSCFMYYDSTYRTITAPYFTKNPTHTPRARVGAIILAYLRNRHLRFRLSPLHIHFAHLHARSNDHDKEYNRHRPRTSAFSLAASHPPKYIASRRQIRQIIVRMDIKEVIRYAELGEPYPVSVQIFEGITRHSGFLKVMLGPNGDISYAIRFRKFMAQHIFTKLSYIQPNEENYLIPRDYLIAYMASANFGLIMHWLESGMGQTPQQMSFMMASLVTRGPIVSSGILNG
jgi:hypothetical protein